MEALIGIADLTGSQGGALFGLERKKGVVAFKHLGRLSQEAQEAHEARHFHDPWSAYMFAQPAGVVVASDHILPLAELERTEFYHEVLRPQGVAHNAMIPLAKKGTLEGAFNMCRSARQGPFDANDRRFLAPHAPLAARAGPRLPPRWLQGVAGRRL